MDSQEHLGIELVVFSDDSNYLISADKCVRIWKRDSFEEMWLKIAAACSLQHGDKKGLRQLLETIRAVALLKNEGHPVSRLMESLDAQFLSFMTQFIAGKLGKI